jgi:hypothetical protein
MRPGVLKMPLKTSPAALAEALLWHQKAHFKNFVAELPVSYRRKICKTCMT